MSIQPLPSDVVAQIKSSTTITTLNGVVCGLVRNALDAGATKVIVSVDYIRGSCSVEDNGLGITPAEFQPSGGLGKLHFTSKYPVRENVHGRYGAFLASLASLSLLSILSHHHRYHSHNSIRIHNSEVLARHIPSPPDQKLLSFPHGTRVTVRDLFGLMPVRVKQRAIDVERGLHSRHWEHLKRDIVALMLAWNKPISVSAKEPPNRWAFSVHCGERQDGQAEDLDLTARVSKILYQGQFSDEHNLETWVPLRASAGRMSVAGAVSLHPVATKRIQFISLGICPVPNEHGSNVLYEEINRAFSNSSYGVEEQARDFGRDEEGQANDGRQKIDGFTGQELKARKGADRWPMFYIKIHLGKRIDRAISQDFGELLDEQQGDLVAIVDVLKAVVYEFLKKYHFRPKRIRMTQRGVSGRNSPSSPSQKGQSNNCEPKAKETTAPLKRCYVGDLVTTQLDIIRRDSNSRSRPESPFDTWTGIKSGLAQSFGCGEKADEQLSNNRVETPSHSVVEASTSNSIGVVSKAPLFNSDGTLMRAPFSDANSMTKSIDQNGRPTSIEKEPLNEGISWTNPVTKETLIVDPVTGFVKKPQTDHRDEEREASNTRKPKRLRLQARPTSRGDRSGWLGELLSSWDNPIFKTAEPPIPSAFRDDNSSGRPTQPFGCSTWLQGCSEAGPSIQGRVSKSALRDAEIIAQVDQKYILAKVLVGSSDPTLSSLMKSLLIIIDQHAADERCRVESLMRGYFEQSTSDLPTACRELLERPLTFDISTSDATQFEHMATYFARWGIHYKIGPILQAGNARHRQVIVAELPPTIAERCRLEPRLLIELLRKEAWTIDEHGCRDTRLNPIISGDGKSTTPQWIALFHGCPEGILDMINSRACRSSIMFNDPLSREECTSLVRRLADCAFPFQCAHGRPSMVPLVHIGDDMACTTNEEKSGDSFMKAFKAWNADGRKAGDKG